MTRKLLAILAVLAFTAMACSITDTISDISDTLETTDGTEIDTASGGDIILTDDFSSSSSGWEIGEYDFGSAGYGNGYYFVTSNTNSPMWAVANQNYQDTIIEVDAALASGPVDNGYGVICRLQEDGQGYYFAISSDGYYSISLNTEDFTELVPWESSSAIKLDNEINHIVVTCNGDQLSLEVNGTLLAEITDTTFTSGDIGFLAGTFEEDSTVEIQFDDLIVRAP